MNHLRSNSKSLHVPTAVLGLAAVLGISGCDAASFPVEEVSGSSKALSTTPYFYLRCNSTGWGVDARSHMTATDNPNVYQLQYSVSAAWTTGSGDDCELTQTDALNGWGTQLVRYVFGKTNDVFSVPGTQTVAPAPASMDAHFKVRYPSLGKYRARLDVSNWKLSIDAGEPPSPAPAIQDLGNMYTPYTSNSSSGIFRISNLPSTSFNVVTLVVEPRDGKVLSGELGAGGRAIALGGWSQKIMFAERGTQPVVFDIALPTRRQIALTWYVEDRVPATKAIDLKTETSGANVLATYGFAKGHIVKNDLALVFPSSAFTDGKVPTYARLEHNPQGVRYPDRPDDLNGPTYNIHANLKTGAKVQVALPVPEFTLLRGIDESALTVMHYNEATKTWSEILPDKIENGYIYFTVDSFSNFFARAGKWLKKAGKQVVEVVKNVAYVAADVVVTFIDFLDDAIKAAYKALVDVSCSLLDFDTYKALFFDNKPPFRAPQADLDDVVKSGYLTKPDLQAMTARKLVRISSIVGPVTHAEREIEEWKTSTANAALLLADILNTGNTNAPRRFTLSGSRGMGYVITDGKYGESYPATDIFRFYATFISSAPRMLEVLRVCDGMLGIADEVKSTLNHVLGFVKSAFRLDLGDACRNILMIPADWADWGMAGVIDCVKEVGALGFYWNDNHIGEYLSSSEHGKYRSSRDSHFIYPSEFFDSFSVLLWADMQFRNAFSFEADTLRDSLHSMIGIMHDAYDNNNIVIKAMAGVALWDMVARGDAGNYRTMKEWLEAKSGSDGGYAEGTGYLQYINVDVPYILSAMVRGGFINRTDLPTKYLRTGEWLFNISHAYAPTSDGLLLMPTDVDDGVPVRPDFLVYAYLTGDGRFQGMAAGNPEMRRIVNPLQAMGLTSATLSVSFPPVLPNVYFKDGVGIVRAGTGASTATLAIIAESGDMLTGAYAHDQQDNTSVTIKRGAADVILDPGYSGAGDRMNNTFTRFNNHSVVMTDEEDNFHGENGNRKATLEDVMRLLNGTGAISNLSWIVDVASWAVMWGNLFSYFTAIVADPGVSLQDMVDHWDMKKSITFDMEAGSGGSPAYLVGDLISEHGPVPSYGLEVRHTSTAGVTNRRLVLAFADHFWIIDRPENSRRLRAGFNWEPKSYNNVFQIPSDDLSRKEDQALSVKQNVYDASGNPIERSYRRVAFASGSTWEAPPVFVTAVPLTDGVKSTFTQVVCGYGTCMKRTTAAGEDLVIVPSWNVTYVDGSQFFRTGLETNQVVLAHKVSGSSTWTYRLVGSGATPSHDYLVVTTPDTWPHARDDCYNRGMSLVTIKNDLQNEIVRDLVNGLPHAWIGVSKVGGKWVWLDGTPASYMHWRAGEPNNEGGSEEYVEMFPKEGKWNDLSADWKIPYVCERK